MKKILKAIGFGIALGATAFFIPFIFKFMLVAIIVGMFFRMFAHNRRRHFAYRFDGHYANNPYNQIIPIDGQWYKPNVQSNGLENNININY